MNKNNLFRINNRKTDKEELPIIRNKFMRYGTNDNKPKKGPSMNENSKNLPNINIQKKNISKHKYYTSFNNLRLNNPKLRESSFKQKDPKLRINNLQRKNPKLITRSKTVKSKFISYKSKLDKINFSNDELKNKISNIINHVEKIEKKDEKRKIYNIIYHAYEKFGELQYFENMIEKIEKLETTSISLVQQIYDDMKKTIENEKEFTLSDYENEYHGLLDKDEKPINQYNAKMRGGEFDKDFEEFKNNKVSNEEYKSPEITVKITQEDGVNWCLLCCLLTIALSAGKFQNHPLKLEEYQSKTTAENKNDANEFIELKKYQFTAKNKNNDKFIEFISEHLNSWPKIIIKSKNKKHELCEYGRGFNAKYLDEIIKRLKLNIKVVKKGAFPYPAGFSFPNDIDNDLCKKYIFYKFAKWANKVGRGKRYIILHAKRINGNTNHYVILYHINSEGMKFWDPQKNNDISDLEIKEEVMGDRKIFRASCNTLGDSSWFLGYIVLE